MSLPAYLGRFWSFVWQKVECWWKRNKNWITGENPETLLIIALSQSLICYIFIGVSSKPSYVSIELVLKEVTRYYSCKYLPKLGTLAVSMLSLIQVAKGFCYFFAVGDATVQYVSSRLFFPGWMGKWEEERNREWTWALATGKLQNLSEISWSLHGPACIAFHCSHLSIHHIH